MRPLLKKLRGMVIDIDGTLLRGNAALPGMPDFFNFLNDRKIRYMVASNNSTKSPATYYKKLTDLGANIVPENILTCSTVTALYLTEKYPSGCSVYIIGQEGIHEAMQRQGIFKIVPDARSKADVVIVGGDLTLTYEKIKNAALHLQRGADFIGTNPDLLYPTEEGLVPECGTNIAALEAATGRKAEVMGKPNHFLFEMALKKMGCEPAEAAVIGDRLETDIAGGRNVGLMTILVETGIDNAQTVLEKGIPADLIISDLCALIQLWEHELSE